jgi:hypothetical protein
MIKPRLQFRRWPLQLIFALGFISLVSEARGDGGTLQLSQRYGELRVSVFTSPAVPRVGMIDVSVFIQDAKTKRVRHDLPVKTRLERVEGAAIPLQEHATAEMATNRLFQAALFDLPKAGRWRVTVSLTDVNLDPLAFELDVAPPLPPWLQLAPWVGWPFAVVALFLVHQKLVASRQKAVPKQGYGSA